MKSQIDLQLAVTLDQLQLHGIPFERDLSTIRSRVETKGESFLTLHMPTLGLVLEQGLRDGKLDLSSNPHFKRRSKTDARPEFLNGLFGCIFDSEGVLLPVINASAIRAVRQICYLHSKLKELPTLDRVNAAFDSYVTVDESISNSISPELRKELRKESRKMWGSHFSRMEKSLFEDSFLPRAKHGPGAVSEGYSSNQKWNGEYWTERLQTFFPIHEYLRSGSSESERDLFLLPPALESPSKVIAVPKTAKGPRIIAKEPVYNQFIQQGLMALFESWMFKHPVVSYEYQEPNRELARKGSIDGLTATLDLSEASDRLSLSLVKTLFRDHAYLLGSILSCRTQRAELPDGTSVLLRKFASMGSALTFPIETLVFATIASIGMRRSGISTERAIQDGLFRVYGDDIIIPVDAVDETVSLLTSLGLKVNTDKSFWTGMFRESCGGDFFAGTPVNPVRVRQRLPQSRRDVDEVVALVAFRNLYAEMYGETECVTGLDTYIEGLIPFPYGLKTTAALVRWTDHPVPDGTDRHLHRPWVYACRPVYRIPNDEIDGEAALLKFFWTPFNEDSKHLQRAGRPISSFMKYGRVLL